MTSKEYKANHLVTNQSVSFTCLRCLTQFVVDFGQAKEDDVVNKDIKAILDGIWEQAEKDQYWNAIYRTSQELMPLLLKAFSAVLKLQPAEPKIRTDVLICNKHDDLKTLESLMSYARQHGYTVVVYRGVAYAVDGGYR